MWIKFCPIRTDGEETICLVIDEWSLTIDGVVYAFDRLDAAWTDVDAQTMGAITSATVHDGELALVVPYRYTADSKAIWEDPNYYSGGGYRGSQYENHHPREKTTPA